MNDITVSWVGWVKDGHIAVLKAGPFLDSDQARAMADKLNENDRYGRHEVVYSDITVRLSYYED